MVYLIALCTNHLDYQIYSYSFRREVAIWCSDNNCQSHNAQICFHLVVKVKLLKFTVRRSERSLSISCCLWFNADLSGYCIMSKLPLSRRQRHSTLHDLMLFLSGMKMANNHELHWFRRYWICNSSFSFFFRSF